MYTRSWTQWCYPQVRHQTLCVSPVKSERRLCVSIRLGSLVMWPIEILQQVLRNVDRAGMLCCALASRMLRAEARTERARRLLAAVGDLQDNMADLFNDVIGGVLLETTELKLYVSRHEYQLDVECKPVLKGDRLLDIPPGHVVEIAKHLQPVTDIVLMVDLPEQDNPEDYRCVFPDLIKTAEEYLEAHGCWGRFDVVVEL